MPLLSVADGTSAQAVAGLLKLLFPDAATVLDATYGSGKFWSSLYPLPVRVTGLDRDPTRAVHVCGDFTQLPFADERFDVVIFDPPYHSDMGRGKASVMGDRFGTYATLPELQAAVEQGCREVWRVSRLGVIVKCMNYIHASRLVHMTKWIEDAIPSPLYDEHHLRRSHKMLDPKWGEPLSVYRNHASFLVFRHGSQQHIRRAPAGGPLGAHV